MLLKSVEPEEAAGDLSGRVAVELCVDGEGNAANAEVISRDPALSAAVLAGSRRYKFKKFPMESTN